MKSAVLSICAVVFLSFVSLSNANTCSSFVNQNVCGKITSLDSSPTHCSAQFEGYPQLKHLMEDFIGDNIAVNYQYMLMATNFGNHQANRPGFESLYRKLSDEAWFDAIKLIKRNARRGGSLIDFGTSSKGQTLNTMVAEQKKHAITEYNSLAQAMDMQKRLASMANEIHRKSIRSSEPFHDPDISSYIEEEFAEKYAKTIRELSGHLSDLNSIMSDYESSDFSLSLYLFDEYLAKGNPVVF